MPVSVCENIIIKKKAPQLWPLAQNGALCLSRARPPQKTEGPETKSVRDSVVCRISFAAGDRLAMAQCVVFRETELDCGRGCDKWFSQHQYAVCFGRFQFRSC